MNHDSTDDAFRLDTHSADGPQIVTFSLGGERFAVPMESVQEIVRVPQSVRVPLASPHLTGLANLRGRVLPIFQCRTMMGMPEQELTDASRVLVLRIGTSVGLVVDRVHAVMMISPDQIDSLAKEDDVGNREWLAGVVRQEKTLTLLLDVERLIHAHASEARQSSSGGHETRLLDRETDEEINPDELQLVSFEVAGQEYAVPIETVQEIVQAPTEYTLLPHTPQAVLGVMVLRNRLLPLISLRAVFGLELIGIQEQHRVVVLQLTSGVAVGVVMDRVNEVLRVPRSVQEAVPALFSNTRAVKHVSSMCRLNEGKRLVSILELESLAGFANLAIDQALQTQELQPTFNIDTSSTEAEDMDDEGQVVVFQLGGEEFGVNIHSVQEIVRVPEQLTRIPQAPPFLEGVINLRGSVLPVIDQRRRMGIEPRSQHDRQRIMVYLMNGVRTGFIVDSVTEVLRIDSKDISDTPSNGQKNIGLLPKVANLTGTKRMILLIDPYALLNSQEIALTDMAIQEGDVSHSIENIDTRQLEEIVSL